MKIVLSAWVLEPGVGGWTHVGVENILKRERRFMNNGFWGGFDSTEPFVGAGNLSGDRLIHLMLEVVERDA